MAGNVTISHCGLRTVFLGVRFCTSVYAVRHCMAADMEGILKGYKIPKLTQNLCSIGDSEPLPDWRLQQRKQFSQIFAARCITGVEASGNVTISHCGLGTVFLFLEYP